MISFVAIVVILFAHFVGDFIFQSDYMATNKSSNNTVLARHVLIYSTFLFLMIIQTPAITILLGLVFAVINGTLHFGTDYVTSRMTKVLWEKGERHNFFVIIGLDQFIHYMCLFTTYYLLTR